MSTTPAAIRRCRAELVPAALAVLPDIRLGLVDRRALGGCTFREAGPFVGRVAKAVAEDPALFAGLAFDPEAVLETQAHADAYRGLFEALDALARRAQDRYLLAQAQATMQAMGVVHQVRHDGRSPSVDRRLQRRKEDALRFACALLLEREDRKKRLAQRRRRAERDVQKGDGVSPAETLPSPGRKKKLRP